MVMNEPASASRPDGDRLLFLSAAHNRFLEATGCEYCAWLSHFTA